MSKNFNLKVNGVELKSNTIYKIAPKKDDNAPDAFRKHDTSKLLVNGVSEGAPCVFNVEQGVWDTGFFPESPCYRGWKSEDIEKAVAARVEYIKKPFELLRGKEVLSHTDDNTFWDSFAASNLWNGRMMDTKQPKHLLELYIASLHRYICTKEYQNQYEYLNASYTVINRDKDVSVAEERKKIKAEALKEYFKMSTSNPGKALEVLRYVGLPHTGDEDATTSIMMDYLDNKKEGHNNSVRLLETLKKAGNNFGYYQINMYTQLADLYQKGVIKKDGGTFSLNNIEIGTDLKAASLSISQSSDKELKELIKAETIRLEA